MGNPWYIISNVEELPSPGLVFFPDRIRANIRKVIEMAGGVDRLRPHIKTHKCGEIIRIHLEHGVSKFKCSTLAEAEMALHAGASDLLIASQLTGPHLTRLRQLRERFSSARVTTICDNPATAQALDAVGQAGQTPLELYLDIDCGMGRTGIAPGESALELARFIATLPGLRLAGLHAYDGHIHDPDRARREQLCRDAFAPVEWLRARLAEAGLGSNELVAGGTPTFPIHARAGGRECSPGTYVFWDFGYQKFSDLDFAPAALVLTRVISRPSANRLCLDLGHKAVASESPPPRVEFLNLPDTVPVMHSEEHLVVETRAAHDCRVGDVLYAIPRHICPTVALHDVAFPVREGRAGEPWPIEARRRRITL